MPTNCNLAALIAEDHNCLLHHYNTSCTYPKKDYADLPFCSGNETLRIQNFSMHFSRWTYAAIYTIGYAIQTFCLNNTDEYGGDCSIALRNLTGANFMDIMRSIHINDTQDFDFWLVNDTGSSPFRVYQYQKDELTGYQWQPVGMYKWAGAEQPSLTLSENIRLTRVVAINESMNNCTPVCTGNMKPTTVKPRNKNSKIFAYSH